MYIVYVYFGMTNGAIDFVVIGFISLCVTRFIIVGGVRLLLAVILICRRRVDWRVIRRCRLIR